MRKQYIVSGSAAPAGRFIISFSVVTSACAPASVGLTADFFQIGGGVAMVIAKHQTRRGLDAQGFERPPKRPWLAEPTEGGNRSCRNLALGDDSRPKNRRVRIVSPDQPLDSQVAILGAGNDDRRGSRQRRERLTQPAERENAAAQRIQRVDQHDIPIALQAEMLESVIEQEDVRLQFPLHPAADFVAIGTDPHMRRGLPHVGLRFVAGLLDRRVPPRGTITSNRDLRPYPRVRMAGFRPASASLCAKCATNGDFPAPPMVSAPTLITGVSSFLERVRAMFSEWPAVQIAASGPRVSRASRV